MDKISIKKVEEIAALARLELSDVEKKMYAEQLSAVFGYVEALNEVQTDEVLETCQVTGLEDIYRADMPAASDATHVKNLIAAFPEKVGNLLKVSAVFDNAEEVL